MQQSATESLYTSLLELHRRMAIAAREASWQDLEALERESAAIALTLQTAPSEVPLDPEATVARKAMISEMLSLQGVIREEISSWRKDAEPLISALASRTAGP